MLGSRLCREIRRGPHDSEVLAGLGHTFGIPFEVVGSWAIQADNSCRQLEVASWVLKEASEDSFEVQMVSHLEACSLQGVPSRLDMADSPWEQQLGCMVLASSR